MPSTVVDLGLAVFLTASAGTALAAPSGRAPSVANLRCEYRIDPLGLDVEQPLLGWQIRSDERGIVQSAYQVQVARDVPSLGPKPLWDTGKVGSDRSIHVTYEGPALESSSTRSCARSRSRPTPRCEGDQRS